MRSCRYLSSSYQSRSVTTMLRSTPCGRGGVGERQLALGDAIGPVAEVLDGYRAEARAGPIICGRTVPTARGASTPHAMRQTCRALRNRPRGQLPELMTSDAAVVLHLMIQRCCVDVRGICPLPPNSAASESSASSTSRWPGSNAPRPPASAPPGGDVEVRPGAVGIFSLSTSPYPRAHTL